MNTILKRNLHFKRSLRETLNKITNSILKASSENFYIGILKGSSKLSIIMNILFIFVSFSSCRDEITIRIKDHQIIRMSRQLAGSHIINTPHGKKIISQKPIILTLPMVHKSTADQFINYISGQSDDMGLNENNFSEFLVLAQNVLGSSVRSYVLKKMCEFILYENNLGSVLLNEYLKVKNLVKLRNKNINKNNINKNNINKNNINMNNINKNNINMNNGDINFSNFNEFLNNIVDLFNETVPQIRDILFVNYSKYDDLMSRLFKTDNYISVYRKEKKHNNGLTDSDLVAYSYDLKGHFNKILLLSYDGQDLFKKVDLVFHDGRKHWLMGNELVDNLRNRIKVIRF
ncbi:hypothetical protein DMUE_1657 [Dictyocoela muelleri]|nr:hypothetical protein DMUE_1657 [Dictyocoela muelleri]